MPIDFSNNTHDIEVTGSGGAALATEATLNVVADGIYSAVAQQSTLLNIEDVITNQLLSGVLNTAFYEFLNTGPRTGTGNGNTSYNLYARGIQVQTEIIAIDALNTLTIKLQYQNNITNSWFDIPGASTTALGTIGGQTLTIYPGITVIANQSLSSNLPFIYRIVYQIIGGGSCTFVVGGTLLK